MAFALIIIARLLGIFTLLMVVRAILSWIPNIDPYHPAIQTLDMIIEPVVRPIRQMMPSMGGLDLSYIVAFILIYVIQQALRTLAASL